MISFAVFLFFCPHVSAMLVAHHMTDFSYKHFSNINQQWSSFCLNYILF